MFRRFLLHKAIGDKNLLLILPKPPLCPRLLLGTFVGNVNIERIAKAKIFDALDKAARRFLKSKGTKKQGYHKVQDGFALLKDIDPEKVCENSKHARRLRETLKSKLPDRR